MDSGSCCTVQQLEELSERGKDKNMDMGFCSPDFENGMSPLHRASRSGNKVAVEWLLCKGHAWNLVDNDGRTCGEMAMENGHDEIYEMLVQEGIRAELILSLLSTANAANEKGGEDDDDQKEEDDKGAQTASNQEYLDSKLEFKDGLLVDQKTDAVMMGWESKFMHDHAIAICPQPGRDVLNVGFGLGIIDSILQDLKPRRHVIIEAHPDVYAKMLADGWDKKPGVEIFFGRWQDQIHNVGCFDGIFFGEIGFKKKMQQLFSPFADPSLSFSLLKTRLVNSIKI